MLKQIDPLISPSLLHVLAMMGHGDELAIVDTNFPLIPWPNTPATGVS
ncbi:RbsD/FucU domain-containing protein [Paracoccus cavernae]|uniref:D-ribose pyranase n=1 Tax=Paracoccus cavernae TaxID=1571207 RepID=A0ABT8D9Q6_9RHOB|nr:RbsD/FucU domain-containing protein [Paracoccus cavernae]